VGTFGPHNTLMSHTQPQPESSQTMTMTIIATYEVRDIDEVHELIASLRELEPIKLGCVGTAYAPNIERVGEMDLTPAHGIGRPGFQTRAMSRVIDLHVAALVAWTREHITEGPISEVSDAMLTECYTDLIGYGYDTNLEDVDDVTASCIRGAFRDATAGMVPL